LFGKALAGAEEALEWFGGLSQFAYQIVRESFRRPFELNEILKHIFEIGWQSAPLIVVSGLAIGAVLSMHTRATLERFGAVAMIPTALAFALVTETGPLVTGLLVSGRVGAGIGAALGGMRVTEQIDALDSLAVNSFKYLVVTRVAACVIALPLLTVVADASGILSGWVANTLIEHVPLGRFLADGLKGITFRDIVPATLRTAVFGFIIGLIGCFQGLRTTGGTEGVARSATSAVVLSTLFVILADVGLVRLIQIL